MNKKENLNDLEIGDFVFINDSFLIKYNLWQNHGKNHNRPFFYSIAETEDLIWVVPLTSDQSGNKQRQFLIYENLKKQNKIKTNPFVRVHLREKNSFAILLDMFPVPKEQIKEIYTDKNGKVHLPTRSSELLKSLSLKFYNDNKTLVNSLKKPIIKTPYEQIIEDYENSKEDLEVEEDEKEFEIE